MSNNGKIPFLDLISLHEELESELVPIFQSSLKTASFIGGPMVVGFEREFAHSCETAHCAGVGSGTDAVRFALLAAGIGQGEIAITVPNTFIATVEGISQAGAEPRFVDVDERTYNMESANVRRYLEESCSFDDRLGVAIENKSGKPVTAIVPVHLYGQMADMDALLAIAEQYNLVLVEDACQAHGAQYFSKKENRWRIAGSMGRAGAFSFYPGKNLGACGEAGAVTTSEVELDYRVRMLRDHGQTQKYYHEIEGYNGRLDAIQAGILQVKLRHLAKWTEARRTAAALYAELLGAIGGDRVALPYEPAWAKCVYHLFVVRVEDRDGLIKHLAAVGIGTGIHYPVPLHLQNAYAGLGYKRGDFPITEKIANEIVSLPMHPHLGADQQSRVSDEIAKFVSLQKPLLAKSKIA
jgi:dTDP-4-amino-4,6-dideoxygalactose transaminase